jgi:hypothetical protein
MDPNIRVFSVGPIMRQDATVLSIIRELDVHHTVTTRLISAYMFDQKKQVFLCMIPIYMGMT